MDMVEIEEDGQFLIYQREKQRIGSLTGPDRSFVLREELLRYYLFIYKALVFVMHCIHAPF